MPQTARKPAATGPTAETLTESFEGRELRVTRWRGTDAATRPLLFFNGIGANSELIAPLADALPERDLVTFDMPGIGGSPDPVLPYRPWMIARIATQILDRFDYRDVDVMGVSWGGGMAQQFAFQHADRTNRLILAATSAGMIMVPGKLSALSKMADPRRYIDPEFMARHFNTLYGGSNDGSGGHIGRITPPSKTGYFYQLLAMIGWTSVPFLPFIGAPTLVMMGGDDPIVPVINGQLLCSLLPNAELDIVDGGGHLFLVSEAQDCVPRIRAFLDDAG